MLSLNVSVTGNVADNLRAVMAKVTNYRPLLEGFGSKLVVAFRRFIDTSTTPTGKPYPPLKRPRPAGHNQDPKPLIDTGTMYDDLQYEVVSADTVKAGSTVPYAVYQNKGTRHIPARTFIGIPPELSDEFTADMKKFLEDAFK